MKYTALILPLLLTGCGLFAKPEPITIIQRVEVPIPVRCQVQVPSKPELYFDKATKSMDTFKKVQLLSAENQALRGYTTELEGALKGCTK